VLALSFVATWVAFAPPALADGAAPPPPPPPAAAPCPPPPPADPCAPAPKKPPAKYENLRFREDWSPLLCTPVCDRCDFTDRLKAIRLSPEGSIWMNVGGQARARYESFENFNFGTAATADDSWLLTRFRLHVDLHLGSHVRVFAEGIYADQDEREAGPRLIDENHGDLLNAFIDFQGRLGPCCDEAGLRVGRFEMNFGKQRVIGAFDWANTRRSYEGLQGWWKAPTWRLDAFVTRPVVVSIVDFDERDDGAWFAGLYYANTRCKDLPWEAYALFLHRDEATFLGETEEEERVTLGVLAGGPIACTRLDWEVEGAYQFGDFGSQSISAGFVTAELGWKPCVACWDPRIAIGADWASGDSDGPGGDLGTYNQLFPTGHLWFGYADAIGRQDVVATRVTVTAKPCDTLTLRGDFHEFWRATEEDAVYTAGGAVLRTASGSDEFHVGAEVDLTVKWSPNRHWDAEIGWAHVFPGAFIEATGAAGEIDFLWTSLCFTF
jgi:hypothetical protein